MSLVLIFVAVSAALTVFLKQFFSSSFSTRSDFHTGLYILLVQLFCLLLWRWILYPKAFSPLRDIPQPKGASFFMGNLFQLLGDLTGTLRTWVEEVPNNGIIRYQGVFNMEALMVVQPAALAELLVHKCYDFEKPSMLKNGDLRLFGDGILFAEGDVHKRQRKTLMPAFSFRHIKDLYPGFWDQSTNLVRSMALQSEKKSIDSNHDGQIEVEVNSWASRATLDIIGVAGFGRDFNALNDPDNEMSQHYRSIFSPSKMGIFLEVLSLLFPFWLVRRIPVNRNRMIKNASDLIKQTCQSNISAKRQQPKTGNATTVDILSVAMSSELFTSDEEIINQMMTFVLAGHETTASALTWGIYLLCRHPDIQIRLRNEISDSSLPNPWTTQSSRVTSNDIDNLPYLNAVCSEILRVYPPVVTTVREAVVDTSLVGHKIPKGTAIVIPPWSVNTSTALWGPDAASFDPERWLRSKSGGADSNYSMLTFIHGPRGCIGERFARAELACLMAAWVYAFETSPAGWEGEKEIEIFGAITIKPKGGLMVKLRPLRPQEA